MSSAAVALIAVVIDRLFGEFKGIRHPVVMMGDYIGWFEKHFYKDSFVRGVLLTLSLLLIVAVMAYSIEQFLAPLHTWLATAALGLLSSMFVAHRMLHDAVLEVATAENPREKVAMLVSRDTADLNESDTYKAAIETYAENLSDGVIAPLFYLLLFGFTGIVVYKAINTLDSMVGYKNERYLRFGKFAARLDDIANYIPARITALMIVAFSNEGYRFWNNGHESPNAGQPITAMALALGIKLGGPTYYEGTIKNKPYFGHGRAVLTKNDLYRALVMRKHIDLMLVIVLCLLLLF